MPCEDGSRDEVWKGKDLRTRVRGDPGAGTCALCPGNGMDLGWLEPFDDGESQRILEEWSDGIGGRQ